MTYTKDELSQLSRKELQKLCKQTRGHVKANKKTFELVCDLAEYYEREESEMMEMEAEMKKYDAIDLNGTWTVDDSGCDKDDSILPSPGDVAENGTDQAKELENNDSSCTLSLDMASKGEQEIILDQGTKEDNDKLKEALMQEVDRRAEEKLSKIPRLFVAEKVQIPAKIVAQATPEPTKKGVGGSSKTADSIDVYLAKKQQRAEGCLKFVADKNKENIGKTISKSSSCLPKPGTGKRKSVKIDKEVTINFAPQIKSTPDPGKRSSPRLSLVNEAAKKRKSVSTLNKSGTDGRRFTVGGMSTPTSKCPTPKFDLKQSLKKPLRYKPHTGKLKEVYFNNNKKGALFSQKPNTKPGTNTTKLSLKEMSKTVSTRDKRRQTAADKRSQSRNSVLDKRRGIVC